MDDAPFEYALLLKLKAQLEAEKPIRALEFSKEELQYIKNYGFLTSKPLYSPNLNSGATGAVNDNSNSSAVILTMLTDG